MPSPILTVDEIFEAYLNCRRHKRSAETAIEFERNLSSNIMRIHDEVNAQTWKPGGHMCFVVRNPKPREVWASQFADRVVHHVAYNRLRPRFEPYWIATSFACIPGRGTGEGKRWAEQSVRKVTQHWSQKAFVLQMDIANFFPRIIRSELHATLSARCHEPWLKYLIDEIVNVDVTINAHLPGDRSLFRLIPKHKSLWWAEPDRGLPIGNLTSQFGANVRLDSLDQPMVRSGVVAHYGRYVDDIVMMDQVIDRLREAYRMAVKILTQLGHELHPHKTRCKPADAGFDFCGHYHLPYRTYLRRRTAKQGTKAARSIKRNPHPAETMSSYLGMARHCDTYNLRRKWNRSTWSSLRMTHNLTRARAIV